MTLLSIKIIMFIDVMIFELRSTVYYYNALPQNFAIPSYFYPAFDKTDAFQTFSYVR